VKRLTKENLVHAYGPGNPARLGVEPGETFVVETHDRFASWQGSTEAPDLSAPALMGVTGAVAIEGAEPGDVLAVDVLGIELVGGWGQINAVPGKGGFPGLVERFQTRRVPITPDGVPFAGTTVPLRPMIGRIGTAPAGEAVPSVAPGPHGGNLDAREVTTGSTIYLPVYLPGGLLSAGDVHAAMGDGESLISGVEAQANLTLRARILDRDLARRIDLQHPLVQTSDLLVALASARTLDEAARVALESLRRLLVALRGLDPIEAAMLISVAADVGVAQLVNPLATAKVAIDRRILQIES
jgi:amidase